MSTTGWDGPFHGLAARLPLKSCRFNQKSQRMSQLVARGLLNKPKPVAWQALDSPPPPGRIFRLVILFINLFLPKRRKKTQYRD